MRSTNPGFVPDSPFTRELTPEWLQFFKKFPKAELHCHLLGTTSRETRTAARLRFSSSIRRLKSFKSEWQGTDFIF